jgi:hypothetical protein
MSNERTLSSRILSLIAGGLGIIAGLCFLVSGLQAILQEGVSIDEVVSAAGALLFGVAFFGGGTILLFSFFKKKTTRIPYILPIVVLAGETLVWLIHFILLNIAGGYLPSARDNLIFLLVFGFAGVFFLVFSMLQKEGKFKSVLLLIGIALAFATLMRGFPYYFGANGAGQFFGAQVFLGVFVAELLAMILAKKEEKPAEPEQ